jgi:hypothetical protein
VVTAFATLGDSAHAPNMNVQEANSTIPMILGLIRRVTQSPRMMMRTPLHVLAVVLLHALTRSRNFQISISVGSITQRPYFPLSPEYYDRRR